MTETQSQCCDFGVSVQTEIRASVFTFNWAIQNISKVSNDELIKSPTFHLDSTHEFYAQFKYHVSGSGCLWFYLVSGPDINIEHNISIINKSGSVFFNKITTANYSSNRTPSDLLPTGTFFKEALKENTLTFKCVLKFDKTHHYSLNENPVSTLDQMSSLSEDLRSLYEAPLHPDITLRVGSFTLPAHKNILSARSSVFARMFETPMEETQKNIVDIPDLDPATVKDLVSYLYTDVLPSEDFESACSLYYAGDKYNVPSLRAACKCIILGKMDVQNACRVLSLADQHSDTEFKNQVMRFINFKFEDVLKTESWSELEKSVSALAIEVAIFCSGKSKKRKYEKVQE